MRPTIRRLCTQAAAASSAASAASSEAEKFSRLAASWWDRAGPLQALHSLNRLRVPLVRTAASFARGPAGLRDADLVDIGCGGGLLAEPLARLGARVLGIDLVPESIAAASDRRLQAVVAIGDRLNYRCQTVSELAAEQPAGFDLAVASEVLEHVDSWPEFVQSAAGLLRPGGCLVVTTVNQTAASYWLGVVAAERLLRLVPEGTHDWRLFIPPNRLQRRLADCGLETRLTVGMRLNPLTGRWSWTSDLSLSYGLVAQKLAK